MKLYELHSTVDVNESSGQTSGQDLASDGQEELQLDYTEKNKTREKILKVGRGDNHKAAKCIAANARTTARSSDQKLSSDSSNQSSHGGYSPNNLRLVT